MENIMKYILIYFIIMNLIAFSLMGIDKYKAIHHKWRIPEKTLFMSAIIGGSIGSILGMYTFRHKTKHTTFVVGMPAIFIIQLAILIFILLS